MLDWNARQYLLFEAERGRAATDLLNRVPDGPRAAIVDMGCGPGNSTRLLFDRFPSSEIVGIDTSDDMLSVARTKLPSVRFERASATSWRPAAPANLIFANAVMQWIPRHLELMTDLSSGLAAGGALAVQMPDNSSEPLHLAIREVSLRPAFRAKLAAVGGSREPLGELRDYFDALAPHCRSVDVWRTTYLQRLPGADAIVEWVKGAGLRPYLDPLNDRERDDFLARYSVEIARAYPTRANGEVLLPFPRMFIVAER